VNGNDATAVAPLPGEEELPVEHTGPMHTEIPTVTNEDPLEDFLQKTAPASQDDKLNGFLHDTAPQIARQHLDEFKLGKRDLTHDQVVLNSKIAADGVGAWESLGRFGKYMFGLLPDVSPAPGETPEQLSSRNRSTLRGVGDMITKGFTGAEAAQDQLYAPEVQLKNDMVAGHPIDALWNYGINKYKNAKTIAQATARGVTGLAPAVVGAGAEVTELGLEPSLRLFGGKDAEQNLNAALNAPVYEMENLKNRAFDRVAKETGVPTDSPLYQFVEQTAPMMIPLGGEEASAETLAKLGDAIYDKGTRAVGRMMQGTAKAGPTMSAVTGAAVLPHHPIVGAELMLPLMYQLAGKGTESAAAHTFGLGRIISGAINGPFRALDKFGQHLASIPDGQNFLQVIRAGIEDESARLRLQIDGLKAEHGTKIDDAIRTTQDGKPVYTAEELAKLGKKDAANAREIQDKIDDLNKKSKRLGHFEGSWQLASAAARTGIKIGLDAAAAGAIGGAFAGSTESPGEYEQARQGIEAGAAIGLAARAPRVPMMIRGEIRNFNRGDLINAGQTALNPTHPSFAQHQDAMGRLSPEAQDYVNLYAGLARGNGRNVVVLPDAEFAAKLGTGLPPNGMYEDATGTAYIKESALKDFTKGTVGHEVGHALDTAAGLSDPSHPVRQAIDEMFQDPKNHQALRDAVDQYNARYRQTRPNFPGLSIDGVRSEIIADVIRDIAQKETPEGLFGGRSLAQKTGALFQKFLDTQPTQTSGFKWPVTAKLRNAVADALFQAGEKAATGLRRAGREFIRSSSLDPSEAQSRRDAIDAINSINKNQTVRAKMMVVRQIDDAIKKLKDAGQAFDTQKLIAATQTRPTTTTKPPAPPSSGAPPSPAPVQPPAPTGPMILGPALVTPQGVEKGTIGQTHADLADQASAKGNATAQEALKDDANHVFHNEKGEIEDRAKAAITAGEAGQVEKGIPTLASEDLADAAAAKAPPVADFEAQRTGPESFLTKEEVAELHRQIDQGNIQDEGDLEQYLDQRMSGERGALVGALKTLQDSGEPFTATFVKKDGTLRTGEFQFGRREGLKGGSKSTAGDPDLYTVYDTESKGYRTIDIKRVQQVSGPGADYRFSKKYEPAEGDSIDTTASDGDRFLIKPNGRLWKLDRGDPEGRYPGDEHIQALQDLIASDPQGSLDIARAVVDGDELLIDESFNPVTGKQMKGFNDAAIEMGLKRARKIQFNKYEPASGEEPRPSDRIEGPAIRVSGMMFGGKSYAEAERAARDFGYTDEDMKGAERGFRTTKGRYVNPDEASDFATERGQIYPEAADAPLRVTDFERWRRFQPAEREGEAELVNLGNGLTPEEDARYRAIKANPEPTTEEADEFSRLTAKIDAYTESERQQVPPSLRGFEDFRRGGLRFQPSDHPDAIKEAAIKLDDGRIFRGVSHGDIADSFPDELFKLLDRSSTFGFVTNSDEFLDRTQAAIRAEKIGQIPKGYAERIPAYDDRTGVMGVKPVLGHTDFDEARRFQPADHLSNLPIYKVDDWQFGDKSFPIYRPGRATDRTDVGHIEDDRGYPMSEARKRQLEEISGMKFPTDERSEGQGSAVFPKLDNPMIYATDGGSVFHPKMDADVVRRAIQEGHDGIIHLDQDAFPKGASETGMDRIEFARQHPDQIDWESPNNTVIPFKPEALEDQPGVSSDKMLDRYNRGEISKDELNQRLGGNLRFEPSDHPDAIDRPAFLLADGRILTAKARDSWHSDVYTENTNVGDDEWKDATDGFIDKKGNFLDRFQALRRAKAIKQITTPDYEEARGPFLKNILESSTFEGTRRFQPSDLEDPTVPFDTGTAENYDHVYKAVPVQGEPDHFTSVDTEGKRYVGPVDENLHFEPKLLQTEEGDRYYRPKDLLGTGSDPKTAKGEPFGVRTYIMYLAAEKQSGVANVCKFATKECAAACLGKGGMGQFNDIREARINKTKYWKYDQAVFMDQLDREISKAKVKAGKDGMKLAIRLNGTSDIEWENSGIMQKHPDVQFYDYTKYPALLRKNLPDNYHITYSYTGKPGSEAFSKSWNDRNGTNTAVVFGNGMPATFMGRPVVDGDVSDLRFMDPKGVIVGLHAKGPALKLIGVSPFIHETAPADVAIPYINPIKKSRLIKKGEREGDPYRYVNEIKDAAPKANDLKWKRGNPMLDPSEPQPKAKGGVKKKRKFPIRA
jgi:Gene product 88